ncbi:unnamed protein product [Discula destructiva]
MAEVVYDVVPALPVVKAHLIVDCVLALLNWVAVALRIRARQISGVGLGWDDYLIIAALPQGVAMLAMQGMYTQLGVGYPLPEVQQNIFMILRILVGYVFVFATWTLTIKLSVLLFYNRIFVNRTMKMATKFTMIFIGLWSVGNIMQIFLICRPFAASYDPTVPGTCGNQKASFIAIGAFNAITDVTILVLPIHTIWSLKTKTGTKLSLLAVFCIGIVTTVVSIIRIFTMNSLDLASNLTGTMTYAVFLSVFEPSLGTLCVSLPMLGPIYHRYIRRGQPTKNTKSSGLGSANALRTFGSSGHAKHYRLDDDATYTVAAGCQGAKEGSPDSRDIELNPVTSQGLHAIKVDTEWVVKTSPR